jgi:hypothetical protein
MAGDGTSGVAGILRKSSIQGSTRLTQLTLPKNSYPVLVEALGMLAEKGFGKGGVGEVYCGR